MTKPDWKQLQAFVRVAERGSLTAAAKELGLSQPTASRYIQSLEEALGARLFVRHSRGLSLSDRGAELFAAARGLDEGVQAVFRHASNLRETAKGTVRVSVNEPLGVHVLPESFARLRREYPEVHIELVIDNAVANLSRREADIAVRMFRPQQLDLVARNVGSIGVGLFASQSYLKEFGTPHSVSEVGTHTLIGFDREPSWLRTVAELGLKPEQFAFRTDSILAQIAAVSAGVGIAGLHLALGARQPGLVRVLRQVALAPLEAWVVMHQDVRGSAAVRVVFDSLCETVRQYCEDLNKSATGRRSAPTPSPASARQSSPQSRTRAERPRHRPRRGV